MFKNDLLFLTIVAVISTTLLFFYFRLFCKDHNLLENFIVKEFFKINYVY